MKIKALLLIAVLLLVVGGAFAQDTADLPDVLVSADWLEERLDDANIRIIEVSVIPGVFERGHIPGAVNFVWHTDFVDTVQRDIVSQERFEQLAREAGINQDTTVILYGDNNNWFAAWGAWIFSLYGFDDVRLLDGGRVKWEADGRALSTRAATYTEGDFSIDTDNVNLNLRIFKDGVLDIVLEETEGVLVDIRGAAEYNGEIFAPEGVQELAVRAGHIPGAVNVNWTENVNSDGTFKSVEELQALYAAQGIDGSTPIVTYCRIGERAALTWFVLHKILGYEVALYDGSWTEWGNSVGVPVVNNAGTVWGGR